MTVVRKAGRERRAVISTDFLKVPCSCQKARTPSSIAAKSVLLETGLNMIEYPQKIEGAM